MHLTGTRLFLCLKFLTFFAAALAIGACGGGSDSSNQSSTPGATQAPPDKVIFMAGFKAQADLPFVGAYVAAEKGYFKEAGLDVEIRHAQSGEHLQLLLAGEIQFTTANGAQVISRNAQGLELVSLALIGQKSEQVFAVAADSPIRTMKDWEGKKIGFATTAPAEFLAITRANGLDVSKIEQVRTGFDPRFLSEGKVDILSVFASNEPDVLAQQGFQTRVFDPSDYGAPSLGLTYITSREYIDKHPDIARRFVEATLRGLDYANQHRDEAIDIVLKYAPQEARAHQRFMLDKEFDRGALTDATKKNGVGWQTQEQWKTLADSMFDLKVIDKAIDVSRIFTNDYVAGTYKNGKIIAP